MPELPEVQTTINVIKPKIVAKRLRNFEYELPKMVNFHNELEENCINDQIVTNVSRRGKYLLFHFENNVCMIIHLRMEGKFYFDQPDLKHNYAFFYFTDGTLMTYNDTRKFGTIDFILEEHINDFKPLAKLGQEPLNDVDNKVIYEAISRSNKHIKTILLDQTIIVGIGNIYADEILYECQIHPLTRGKLITRSQVDQIIDSTKSILQTSIDNMGTSIKSYETIAGKGRNQLILKAYQNNGNPCFRCGTPIEKIKVNGRGTHYCPVCQIEVV